MISANDPSNRPLNLDELTLLQAIREVWCGHNHIDEDSRLGDYQQILIDLIEWYQSGVLSVEELYIKLDAKHIGSPWRA